MIYLRISLINLPSFKGKNSELRTKADHRSHEAQEEGRPKCECFVSSEKGNKILTRSNMEIKCRTETEGKTIQRLSHLGIHPIYCHQTPTLLDAKKCLLKGAWYGGLLRGLARAWQIQRQMLAANHWTEHEVPSEGVRERTEGAERGLKPYGKTNNINQPDFPELPGTKPPTKEHTWLQLHM